MYGPESDYAPPSTAARVYAFLRIAFALLILAMLAYQLHLGLTRHHTGVVPFFSYFTVLSNILLAAAFLISSTRMLRAKESTHGLERLRGAAVVYMMTTGAVFALILAPHGPAHVGITEVWVNRVVHRIAPVVAPLDWMLAPPRIRLRPTAWLSWLLFPLAYLAYTLIRGPLVHWYPYPFLDPSTGGYAKIAISTAAMALGMVALSFLVGWIGNILGRKVRGA